MTLGPIRDVLQSLAGLGRTLEIWWRDDDAVAATPALDRLLAMADRTGAPLGLAAIPASTEPSLPKRLRTAPHVDVLVHGLRHANHAPPRQKRAEFGAHRDPADLARDAQEALRISKDRFGPALLPVFVPPWNRIAPSLATELAGAGYLGLSTFGAPSDPSSLCEGVKRAESAGVLRIDTHLDPIDWRGTRGLVASERLADALRHASVSRDPVGLLTHHLVYDEALWSFTESLLELFRGHEAVCLVAPRVVWRRETLSQNCAGMRATGSAQADA